MNRILLRLILILSLATVYSVEHIEGGNEFHSPLQLPSEKFTQKMHISRGGQLYDNWWRTTVDTKKPEGNHPLWKSQDANKRSGYASYRCKECHGWDYRGKDGAYGEGSHYTGFPGVYETSQKMTVKELDSAIRGSTNSNHDFSRYLSKDDISDLALFLKKGVIETGSYVNANGTPVDGNIDSGRDLFVKGCMIMCHSSNGTTINFGSEEKPEFVGTVANNNPWEFIHKVRAGQPGTRMSSGIIYGWRENDIRDLLAYSQTLPKDKPAPGWFDWMLKKMGFGDEEHKSRILEKYRGFGPSTKYHGIPD
jgi:thiosulfate dehydrogenase